MSAAASKDEKDERRVVAIMPDGASVVGEAELKALREEYWSNSEERKKIQRMAAEFMEELLEKRERQLRPKQN